MNDRLAAYREAGVAVLNVQPWARTPAGHRDTRRLALISTAVDADQATRRMFRRTGVTFLDSRP